VIQEHIRKHSHQCLMLTELRGPACNFKMVFITYDLLLLLFNCELFVLRLQVDTGPTNWQTDTMREWVSSFLTANQHILGHSVPQNGVKDVIKEWKYNQGYLLFSYNKIRTKV